MNEDLNRSPNKSQSNEKTDKIVKKTDGTTTKGKRQKNIRKQAKERRMEILNKVIKKIGFRNARERTKKLSETYGIAERNIRKDFEWIKKNVQPEDRKEIEITVRAAIDRALDTAMERFVTEPTMDNAQKIIQITKSYREELEAWGEKGKVADKHQFEGLAANIRLIETPIDQIKNERNKAKRRRSENKSEAKRDSQGS